MKVLHCIPSMGGGGAERQLCYMAHQMTQIGLDVHVVCFQGGVNHKRLNESGATIHHFDCYGNYDPRIIFRIVSLIRTIRPHIIQTWIPQMDILGGLAAIFTNTPFILSERASALAYGHGWKERLRIWVARRANAIVANSRKGIEYWAGKVEKPQLKVVRNGVPIQEINDVAKFACTEKGVDDSTEIILFAGRYDDQKNLYVLLEALNIALKKRSKAVAFLFGRGPQKENLIRLKEQYSVKDRIFIYDYSQNFWRWLKTAALFVSVSVYEGTPNTVLEAVASRCPVVVSDIPEHKEILDEMSSYMVPVSDTRSIANGITIALSNPMDSQKKAAEAFKRMSDWTIESVAQDYSMFYENVLNQLGKVLK
jgi:glycosyltransferase involved in cell wall biosynthesis